MSDGSGAFQATQREACDGTPGATAAFPYDRMTVERFRQAFPRARWREDLGAWFVPGPRAGRRLATWAGREWAGVLRFADERGHDAFSFEPTASPYLEAGEDLVVRTPYSRAVIAKLREVPWARWDPDAKAWRVPFRSYEALRWCWPTIEEAARAAEPEARRRRTEERRTAPGHEDRRAEAAEHRRRRYPVPPDTLPPPGQVLMTHAGCVVFEEATGELAELDVAARFYPDVVAGPAALVWTPWRRPNHDELVRAWPARADPTPAELARGWWQPTTGVLREQRRQAASLKRAHATRQAKTP